MCTYNIMLDDQLVAEAENVLGSSGKTFQQWLQQQVEALLREEVNRNRHHLRVHRRGLSDEQLAEQLAKYAQLTDEDFPDLSRDDYKQYIRTTSGRIGKGLEKWL